MPILVMMIGSLVAMAESFTKFVPPVRWNLGPPEILVTVRIRWHLGIHIVPGRVDSSMKSLLLYLVIFMRRLLPSKVDTDLSVRPRHQHRACRHSRHQRACREHG